MGWRDDYEKAKSALNKLYDAATTEAQRDKIEAKQLELIQANVRYVIEQMKTRATEMRVLIGSLEAVVKPNAAGAIGKASRSLARVLENWRRAIGDLPEG